MIAGHEAEEDLEALKAEMGDADDLMGGSRRDGKEQ
ncbi:TRAP transporter small permease, partial [Vibrio vulnificus]